LANCSDLKVKQRSPLFQQHFIAMRITQHRRKKGFIQQVACGVLFLLSAFDSAAQDYWKDKLVWADGGIHFTEPGRAVLDVGVHLNHGYHVFSAQIQGIGAELFTGPANRISSINILYGGMLKSEFFYASVAAGVGLGSYRDTRLITRTPYHPPEEVPYATLIPSLPLEAKLGVKLGNIGCHLKVGASVNARIPVTYMGVGLSIGQLY
jgi:hypothetical protein